MIWIKILLACILMLWVLAVIIISSIAMAIIREKMIRRSGRYGTINRKRRKRRR